jgi:predicted PurR-regulated permease PerM
MDTQADAEPKKPFSPLVFRYFLLLFLVSFLLLGRLLWPFFSILILSFLLAGLFQPVFRLLHDRFKFSGQFSSLVTCGLIVIVVFVPLTLFVLALSRELLGLYPLIKGKNLAFMMQQLLEENVTVIKLKELFAGFGVELHPERLTASFSELGKTVGLFLYNQASFWAANIMNFVFSFFMMIVVIFFLLIDQERFFSYILDLSPLPDQQERQLVRRFEEIAKAVLVGNGLCGLLQGFLGGAVFFFFGIGSPILWGGIMAILAFLPIVGMQALPSSCSFSTPPFPFPWNTCSSRGWWGNGSRCTPSWFSSRSSAASASTASSGSFTALSLSPCSFPWQKFTAKATANTCAMPPAKRRGRRAAPRCKMHSPCDVPLPPCPPLGEKRLTYIPCPG